MTNLDLLKASPPEPRDFASEEEMPLEEFDDLIRRDARWLVEQLATAKGCDPDIDWSTMQHEHQAIITSTFVDGGEYTAETLSRLWRAHAEVFKAAAELCERLADQ